MRDWRLDRDLKWQVSYESLVEFLREHSWARCFPPETGLYFKREYYIIKIREGLMKAEVTAQGRLLFYFKIDQFIMNPTISFLSNPVTGSNIDKLNTINPANIIF